MKIERAVVLGVMVVALAVSACSSGGSGDGGSPWYQKGYRAGQSLNGQFTSVYGVDNTTSNAQCVQYWNENMPDSGNVPTGTPVEQFSSGWVAACEGAPNGQPGSPDSLPPGP